MKPAVTPWLRLAKSFFDLRMFQEAWATLDDLKPPVKTHPEALMLRLEILLAQHKSYEAAGRGADYCRAWPTHGDFFLKTAEALMELTDYEKALLLLRSAPKSLHKDAMYHYIIASCACHIGRLEEAKAALEVCYDPSLMHHALTDPNFEPIWQTFGLPSQWRLAK